MKQKDLKPWMRLLLVLCGIGLVAVLFVPLWRIDLDAPQYPEGLKLLIYPGKLAGNVDIINGLNHYIGMKTLHSADFFEFTILPYLIGFFAALFVITGIAGSRKLLYILFVLFVAFGVTAMYDFWRWEYNYGHNLNPDAAIVVPGMAYQPPLIGFKQLLNFGAYSAPDTGGWIFVSAGAVLLLLTIVAWRRAKKSTVNINTAIIAGLCLLTISSCNAGPEPLKTGVDNCYFCKMTLSDARFGAEIVTKKGKVFKFDDIHCLLSYLSAKEPGPADVKNIYLADFAADHKLINADHALLLRSAELKSPMGGNIAAFGIKDSLTDVQKRFVGEELTWNQLYKP